MELAAAPDLARADVGGDRGGGGARKERSGQVSRTREEALFSLALGP